MIACSCAEETGELTSAWLVDDACSRLLIHCLASTLPNLNVYPKYIRLHESSSTLLIRFEHAVLQQLLPSDNSSSHLSLSCGHVEPAQNHLLLHAHS